MRKGERSERGRNGRHETGETCFIRESGPMFKGGNKPKNVKGGRRRAGGGVRCWKRTLSGITGQTSSSAHETFQVGVYVTRRRKVKKEWTRLGCAEGE